METQFILHILLSLGRFSTEIDLIQQSSLRASFRYAKLIGLNNDNQSLGQYSNSIFVKFIEEQLIYFPNSRSLIDSWITISGELFDNVIKKILFLLQICHLFNLQLSCNQMMRNVKNIFMK